MKKTGNKKLMHLFRGAPNVCGWSKYQQTVMDWTLCGIFREKRRNRLDKTARATEDPSLVLALSASN
jgi:hypothetical protein